MNAQTLFTISNSLAMLGWLLLVLYYPMRQRLSFLRKPVEQAWVPVLLSVTYTAVMISSLLGWLPGGSGNFSSIAGVRSLFEADYTLLAGWVHYLAFDLFVGIQIARAARPHNVSILILLPIWFFTFMFGPVGYLLWRLLRPWIIKDHSEVSA